MIVYRVEMPDGIGPYRSKYTSGLAYVMVSKHSDNKHPVPTDDFDDCDNFHPRDYLFGFASPQSLFAWFGGFIRPLIDEGANIVKYKINKLYVVSGKSNRQIIFRKERAERL